MPVSALTEEQKTEFLEHVRAGDNRSAAAIKVGTTGTQIKKMLHEGGAFYDPDFAALYMRAVAERDPAEYARRMNAGQREQKAEIQKKTLKGFTKWQFITDDELEQFLEQVADGTPRQIAAEEIDTTLRQIDLRAKNDEAFHHRYLEALDVGYPHFQELLRTTAIREALEKGNTQMLRDLLIVHVPEFEKLRTSRHEVGGIGGGAIKVLQAALPQLPPEMLQQVIEQFEQKTIDAGQKAIGA